MTVSTPIKAAFSAAKISDHTGAGATYVSLGTPFPEPLHLILITSTFDAAVFLSTDGAADMILVPEDSVISIDLAGNKQGTAKLFLPQGTQFYLKQGPDGAPTDGDICISGIYAR